MMTIPEKESKRLSHLTRYYKREKKNKRRARKCLKIYATDGKGCGMPSEVRDWQNTSSAAGIHSRQHAATGRVTEDAITNIFLAIVHPPCCRITSCTLAFCHMAGTIALAYIPKAGYDIHPYGWSYNCHPNNHTCCELHPPTNQLLMPWQYSLVLTFWTARSS